jgi:hypothetical protein
MPTNVLIIGAGIFSLAQALHAVGRLRDRSTRLWRRRGRAFHHLRPAASRRTPGSLTMSVTVKQRLTPFLPAIIDLVAPTAGYYLMCTLGVAGVWALTIAGSAAGLTTLGNSVRRRRLDALGALVVTELALSVALAAATHNPRLILARASLYLAAGGVFALATCLAGRPATYAASKPMATKGDPELTRAYAAAWDNSAEMRRIHTQLTAAIGTAVLIYAALRLVIIFEASSVSQAVWAAELPAIVLIVFCVVVIRLRVPALTRIVLAEKARFAAASAPGGRGLGKDSPVTCPPNGPAVSPTPR